MSQPENIKPVITPEELALLIGPEKNGPPSGADPGFKYRNAFLLLVCSLQAARLLFFPAHTLASFGFPADMAEMTSYVQLRGWYVVVVTAVYVFSYVKDWYFPRVALVIATLAFAGLVSDTFNVYRFIVGPISPLIIFLVTLRVGAIYCLFMNSVRDNRAPPMPRHLFS